MGKDVQAYLAGLLDGEGYLGATIKKKRGGSYSYHVAVRLCMTAIDLLRWVASETGGRLTLIHYRNPRSRKCGDVRWNKPQTVQLLRLVLPYLRLKDRQARLLLGLASLQECSSGGHPFAWEIQTNIYMELRKLNRRGRDDPPPNYQRIIRQDDALER
jgi:hypothetical protein